MVRGSVLKDSSKKETQQGRAAAHIQLDGVEAIVHSGVYITLVAGRGGAVVLKRGGEV